MRELNVNKQAFFGTNEPDEPKLDGFFEGLDNIKEGTFDSSDDLKEGINLDEYKPYLGGGDINITSSADNTRARNQSNWEQAGNAVKKFLPNVGLEILSQVGNLLDVEDYVNTDDEVGNWLSNWAQDRKKDVNSHFSIYRENPNEALNVGDFAWWMENGSALVESVTAFAAVGYATGGLSLNALNNGKKALETLKLIGQGASNTDKARKITQGLGTLSNAMLLNHAEGMGIATNVYKESYEKALKDAEFKGVDKPEEYAKQIAATKAESALKVNKLNILLNLTSASLFIKSPKLSRQIRDKASIKKSAKTALSEGVQEGAEETINMVAEKQALAEDYRFNDLLEDVFSKEGAENALLGFAGGLGQTTMTNAGRTIKLQKDETGNRVSAIDRQNSLYKQQQDSLTRINDLNKASKISESTDVLMRTEEVFTLKNDILKAEAEGKKEEAEKLKHKLTSNQAYDAFANGTTEQYLNIFEGIQNLTEEQAVERGLDKDTYKQKATEAISYISELESSFNLSQNYINQYEVYANRADNLHTKQSVEKLETNLPNLKNTVLNDLKDLGIEDSNIIQAENGKIGIKYQNTNIKELPSLVLYNEGMKRLDALKKSQKTLNENFLNLISNKTQKEVKTKINQEKRKEVDNTIKEEVIKSTEKRSKKKEKVVENAKEEVAQKKEQKQSKEEAPIGKTAEKVNSIDYTFKSQHPSDEVFVKGGNAILNKDLPTSNRLERVNKAIQSLEKEQQKGNEGASGMLIQFNEVKRLLESKLEEENVEETNKAETASELKDKFNKFADSLNPQLEEETDLNPITEKEKQTIHTKVDTLIDILNYMDNKGYDTTDFKTVFDAFISSVGEEKAIQLFEDFKAIYNLTNQSPQKVTQTYEELYLTLEEKESIVRAEEIKELNKYFSNFYYLTETEFKAKQKEALRILAQKQGYVVYKGEDISELDVFKLIEGHNKVAYLAKNYNTIVKPTRLGFNAFDFAISKEDVDREVNKNADINLLDPSKIKGGESITFKVLDEVIYDDGTIVKKDGTVEKDGVISQQLPEDIAPIAIYYKGEQLKGAFLHTTEWLNESNIAYPTDVERQVNELRKIRQKVLQNKEGVTTTISSVSEGWLLQDASDNLSLVKDNLPKIELGVAEDGVLFVNNNKHITPTEEVYTGFTYGLAPVGDKTVPVPLERASLKDYPQYVESILEAVSIFIKNDKTDLRYKKLFNEYGIDVTSDKGLEEFLSKFIYLYPYKKDRKSYYEFTKFKDLLNNSKETVSMIRFVDGSLQFGRGLGVGNTIASISQQSYKNTSKEQQEEALQNSLTKLKNVLENNTRLNVNKKNLGKKDFKLPLFTKNDVVVHTKDYNEFLKEHLKTNFYSVTLDNGKEIYTVQRTMEFDTSFIEEKVVPVKEVQETKTTSPSKTIESNGNQYTFSLDDDLNPITLTEKEEKTLKEKTPTSLLIQGVPVSVQNDLIDHLASNFLKKINIDKDLQGAFDFIANESEKGFKDIVKAGKDFYYDVIQSTEGEQKKSAELRYNIANNIYNNFGQLVSLTLDRLQTINNLDVNTSKNLAKFKSYNEFLNEQNLEQKEQNNWEADDVFKEDIKSKMSTNIKNFFSYIENAKFNKEGKIVPVKKFLNVKEVKAFDEVVNDLNALLAYSSITDTTNTFTPSYENMISILEGWVNFKPYIKNVIDKLKQADEKTKNEFVQVMSKHYTNHIYIRKTDKGHFIGNSDNNTVVKIMQQNWLNNLYDNGLITEVGGEFLVSKERVEELNTNVDTLITSLKENNPSKYTQAGFILNQLGFNFDDNLVKLLIDKGIKYTKVPHSLLTMLTSKNGVFKIYLDNLNKIKGTNVEENHPFEDNSALTFFTRELAKSQPVYFANSFKDVRGKGYFAYSQNKFLTDRVKALKSNYKGLYSKLSEQAFTTDSTWLNEFMDETSDFNKHFRYFTFDGVSSKEYSAKLETASPEELEEVKLSLFFNNIKGKNDSNFVIKTLYPTTSNKKVSYGLQFKGHNYRGKLNEKGFLINSEKQRLFDTFLKPEINRILHLQNNLDRYNIKGYVKGGTSFILFPKLNTRTGKTAILWNKDGTLREDILTNKDTRVVLYTELLDYVNTLVNERISTWEEAGFVSEKEDDSTGEIRTIKQFKFSNHPLREEAYNYELNYLESNLNTFQLFITDPAFYWKSSVFKDVRKREEVLQKMVEDGFGENVEEVKDYLNNSKDIRKDLLPYYTQDDWLNEHEDTFNNIGKRLAGDAAPGIDLPDSNTNSFTLGHLKDSERSVYLEEYYKAVLGKDASDYLGGVNSTDAQELTTLAEHLYILNKQGKISSEEVTRLLDIEENDGNFERTDLNTIFQPLKPVYVQNIWQDGLERRIYVKSSSFPLFKQLTTGLELDKLRKAMLSQNIDRVAFESAVKVGGSNTPTQIYDSENVGTIKDNIEIYNLGTLPREGFKIQQEVPYNENKQYINDGTQQIKLLTANLRDITGFKIKNSDNSYTGQQIQDELDQAYNRLFELNYKALQQELEYDVYNDTINTEKLAEVLRKEALQRGYNLNDIEALNTLKEENGDSEFEVPLWLNGVAGKLEAMLNSIVDNRVRKLKPKGKSYVLGMAEGFKPILEGNEAQAYINSTKGIVWDNEWYNRTDGQLAPMRIMDAEGNLYGETGFNQETASVKYAEILVPFNFTDSNGNKLDLTRYTTVTEKGTFINIDKLNPELLNLFGFRIPTQYLNSMSAIKIVGFLPKQSGDLLIAPPDWTVQMGSDFDVDKVFSNSYNTQFNEETGELTRYEGEEESKILENRVLDLHFSILGNPNKEVQKRILKPLDFGMLKDLSNELYPHTVKRTKGQGLTSDYQSFKYLNARAGKAGIGTFSTDSTFMASIQNKDIYLQEYDFTAKEYIPYYVTIGGQTSNLLSEVNVNTKGKKRDKLDVISAFQSLAVDDENEQGLFKLNVNNSTFGVIRTMALLGFEEDIISYFINQPIIRKYSEYFVKANSKLSDIKSYEIDSLIEKDFKISENIDYTFIENHGNVSKEKLVDVIKSENYTNESQRALYEHFKNLNDFGKNILYVQSTINTHSAGIGKDLFYSSLKENQLLKLGSYSTLANADKLIGDYQSFKSLNAVELNYATPDQLEWHYLTTNEQRKNFVDKKIEEGYVAVTPISNNNEIRKEIAFIKPTTINGFTSVYALQFNNKLWSNYFPYNNKNIKNIINSLSDFIGEGKSLTKKAENNREAFDTIKRFLASKFFYSYSDGDTSTSERNRLLLDTNTNSSLASILHDLRNGNKLNNPFINRLNLELKKNVLPSKIKYQANIAENIDEKLIYSSIQSMLSDNSTELGEYNGINYTPRKIVQDLVTYSLLNAGVQQSNEFIKYIPLNYLQSLGYFNQYKNIRLDNTSELDNMAIYNQYAQHNPAEVVLNKANLELFNSYEKYNEGTYLIKPEEATKLPSVFSIKNSKAVSGYSVYFYNAISNAWHQKDTLGNKELFEYDGNSLFGETVIPSNQVKRSPKITLPTNPIDTKDFLNLAKNQETSDTISKEESFSNYYKLEDTEKTDTEKIAYILNKIVNNNSNPLEQLFASELLKNIETISNYNLIISDNISAKGFHSYENKNIGINVGLHNSKEDFEKTFLEELIHAFTKKAIIENKSGEVLRLKGLRDLSINKMRNYYKEQSLGDLDNDLADVVTKLQEGNTLTTYESEVLYPLINDTEFIGRLFKSQQLQNILNNTKGKESILDKIYDFIIETLNSLGLDIKKGSALEYAFKDIISLINTQTPIPSNIQGELNSITNYTRTPDYLYEKFNLKNEDGSLKEFKDKTEANEIINYINNTITNVTATLIDDFIVIENNNRYNQLSLDLSPKVKTDIFEVKEGKASPLLRSYNNRIKSIERSIDKANSTKDYERSTILTEQLNSIIERRKEALKISSLRDRSSDNSDIYYKGKQDLEEVRQMFNNKLSVEDTLYIRKVLGFWSNSQALLFNEDELKSEILVKDFNELINEADGLKNQLVEIETTFMNDFIKQYGRDITVKDIFNHYKDINGLTARMLDISRSSNNLLDSVYLAVKEANVDALDESKIITDRVNSLEEKILPLLRDNGDKELYELFRQRTKNGKLTGHIVKRYTANFIKDFNRNKYSLESNRNGVSFSNFLNWSNKNLNNIDLRSLFPQGEVTEEIKVKSEKEKERLKNYLGEIHYNEFIKNQAELINEYNSRRKAKMRTMISKYNVASQKELVKNKEAQKEYATWVDTNSPFRFYEYMSRGLSDSRQKLDNFYNLNYVEVLPKTASMFDVQYKKIEANKDLLEFYNYYTEIDKELRSYLPAEEQKKLAYYGIPHIEKTLLDLYKDKGMKLGLAPIWDSIRKSVRSVKDGQKDTSSLDPVTNKEDINLNISLVKDTGKDIKDFIDLKVTNYKINNGENPTKDLIDSWREEKIDELAQLKSYDLAKILRVYALSSLAYKHKSKIEDSIQLAQNILKEQKEVNRDASGGILKDEKGNPTFKDSSESFKNTKRQFDYFTQLFFGKSKKEEGKTSTEVLTKEEKDRKKEYSKVIEDLDKALIAGTITEAEHKAKILEFKVKIDSLGGVAVNSKRGDNALKWVQLVKMGWNAMSSVANVGFGYIANRIEGSGGLLYSNENLTKAYKMMPHSIYKNLTFNKATTPTATKIRNIMDKWDVLKDASHELFTNPFDVNLGKSFESLKPYNLTQRTEYLNQAPILIATLLGNKVKTSKGEVNLWDALDKDGNWNTKEYGEYLEENAEPLNKLIKRLRIKIDQINKMNHGNYDPISGMELKNEWWGRAVSQFRSWMMEGYATRFENYKDDILLGERKGRYRSARDFFKEVGFGKASELTLKRAIRSLTLGTVFGKADFNEFSDNENLKEIDLANMRKVVTELGMYVTLYTSYLMLSAFKDGLDDDDDRKFALNLIINQGLRLETDILFYLNPNDLKNLVRDLVPATSIITDTMSFMKATKDLIEGEDEISTGVYSGNSRFLREFSQMLPLGTQGYKTYNYGVQTFDK